MPITEAEERELLELLELEERILSRSKIDTYYPAVGPLRRELYPKHLEFFKAGALHRERGAICANRIGKTEGMGGYETVLHLTGRYPDWWEGKRFSSPISAWASSNTTKTTFEIIQRKLLGPPGAKGTGLIPGECVIRTTPKHGIADAVDTIYVKHATNGQSELTFKSYDQGRDSFQGTAKHLVWFDEEPPLAIYTEGLLRTMTTDGIVIATMTPLLGLSEVICYFMDIKGEESK